MLAVVVHHRVVERVDALEIFGIEHVLGAGAVDGLGAEIGLEQPQDRPQHRHAGQAELAAFALPALDQVFFEQRIEHQPRRFGDFGQHMIELLLRAHHRVKMLDRRHIGVLRGRRARDRDQRFAGRVGNQMQMEITGIGHCMAAGWRVDCWGEGHGFSRRASSGRGELLNSIHIADLREDARPLSRVQAAACGQAVWGQRGINAAKSRSKTTVLLWTAVMPDNAGF